MSQRSQNVPIALSNIIERRIYLIRGRKVMLDSDLADLYGVTTGNLNLAIRRHSGRFPDDFMFRLTQREMKILLLQNARAKEHGGRRTLPYVFTEQGVAMLSSVLKVVWMLLKENNRRRERKLSRFSMLFGP